MPPRRRAKPPEWRREGVRRTIFSLRNQQIRSKIGKIYAKSLAGNAAKRRGGSLALPIEASSQPGTFVLPPQRDFRRQCR